MENNKIFIASDHRGYALKENMKKIYPLDDLGPLANEIVDYPLYAEKLAMKIKGEEYVRLHRILTNISNRDIWEYLKDGKPLDEILDKVPDEFYDWVKQTKEELLTQFETLDKEYQWIFKIINRVHGIENRGVFASYAKMYKHPNLLFNMLDGKEYTEQIWKLIYPPYSKPFKKNEEN
jgi:RNA ligase